MQKEHKQDNDTPPEPIHELWLIYCQLKAAETDPEARDRLISSARAQLGHVVNALNRYYFELKSPGIQADSLNCRQRQKGLTPDIRHLYYVHDVFHGSIAACEIVNLSRKVRLYENPDSGSKFFIGEPIASKTVQPVPISSIWFQILLFSAIRFHFM